MNYDKDSNCWYIRQCSSFNWVHTGHSPVLRDFRDNRLSNIPSATLDTASELLKSQLPPAAVSKFIESDCGQTLSEDSLQYLRKLVLKKEHGTTDDQSSGQRLIQILDSTEGVSYVTYTGKTLFAKIFDYIFVKKCNYGELRSEILQYYKKKDGNEGVATFHSQVKVTRVKCKQPAGSPRKK